VLESSPLIGCPDSLCGSLLAGGACGPRTKSQNATRWPSRATRRRDPRIPARIHGSEDPRSSVTQPRRGMSLGSLIGRKKACARFSPYQHAAEAAAAGLSTPRPSCVIARRVSVRWPRQLCVPNTGLLQAVFAGQVHRHQEAAPDLDALRSVRIEARSEASPNTGAVVPASSTWSVKRSAHLRAGSRQSVSSQWARLGGRRRHCRRLVSGSGSGIADNLAVS
jgi:hypothetical protein